ncbi:MAG TPA: VCBS repeat-containing protein [Thermoanaerobaculia bacterium]|nr:VCBS repeat-containing protein [Thermoanaerobaculia bacterium]
MSIRGLLAVVLSFSILAPLVAQTGSAPPPPKAGEEIEGGTPAWIRAETPDERKARLGTSEDPGLDPDPDREWERFGYKFKVERYPREFASYEDQPPGMVRPMAQVNFAFEIYQQNDKYVWVWMPTVEEILAAGQVEPPLEQSSIYTEPQIAYLRRIAPEFTPLNPGDSAKVIRFENSSRGLPSEGSWRNSATIADMNGDGHPDIIAPPERGGHSIMPAIFLGDGKGNWTPWADAVWPVELQYGNVVAADFNGDGIMDLAFGQHLTGPRVLLGDGKGRFRDASEGMADEVFPTRRVVAADVNANGQMDLIALYEGAARDTSAASSKIRVYINQGKAASWKVVDGAAPNDFVSGDWLAVGKFNKDRYPDLVSSNQYFQRPETLFQSTGPAKWKVVDWQDGALVPYLSTYGPVATGRFSSRTLDDAIVTFGRVFLTDVDPRLVPHPELKTVVGVDRISFTGKVPTRTSIMRWEARGGISGIAAGDFDGDGHLDILMTRNDPREVVLLLGDGKGGFSRATVEGLDLASNTNYDLTVGDVNGDGLPDVLLMYESAEQTRFGRQNGSIRLFLNRGVEKPAAAKR